MYLQYKGGWRTGFELTVTQERGVHVLPDSKHQKSFPDPLQFDFDR